MINTIATEKHCTRCKIIKPLNSDSFHKNTQRKAEYRSWCKVCHSESSKRYNRSKIGHLIKLFDGIKRRIKNKPNYKNIKLLFTKQQFIKRYMVDSVFLELHKSWTRSGYVTALSPSIDRTDNEGNYSLDNIQIITLRENASKSNTETTGNRLSQFVGVTQRKNRFDATVTRGSQYYHLGTFTTEKQAAAAVNKKCRELGIPIKNPHVRLKE